MKNTYSSKNITKIKMKTTSITIKTNSNINKNYNNIEVILK